MNYIYENKPIPEMIVGDTMEMSDGTMHLVVDDPEPGTFDCSICSLVIINRNGQRCGANRIHCVNGKYHFNSIIEPLVDIADAVVHAKKCLEADIIEIRINQKTYDALNDSHHAEIIGVKDITSYEGIPIIVDDTIEDNVYKCSKK